MQEHSENEYHTGCEGYLGALNIQYITVLR